jgi:hypothetical protein
MTSDTWIIKLVEKWGKGGGLEYDELCFERPVHLPGR